MQLCVLGKNSIRIGCSLLLACWGAVTVAAEEFSTEISYRHYEVDLKGGDSFGDAGFARWYFDPVKVDGAPLAEAAFLDRARSISVSLSKDESDSDFGYRSHSESIGIVYASPKHPLTLNGQYRTSKFEPNDFDGSRSKEWTIGAGYYLKKELLLSAVYSRSKNPSAGPSGDHFRGEYSLGVKWVGLLPNKAWLSINANFSRDRYWDDFGTSSRGQRFNAGGNFYFTPLLSVGLRYSRQADDDSNFGVRTYAASTKKFINARFFIEAEVRSFRFEGSGGDTFEQWVVGFGYRF